MLLSCSPPLCCLPHHTNSQLPLALHQPARSWLLDASITQLYLIPPINMNANAMSQYSSIVQVFFYNSQAVRMRQILINDAVSSWAEQKNACLKKKKMGIHVGIHVGPPKLSLCTKFERNPFGVVRVTAWFTSKMAAILNDIKNLFDVHNPQTIPDHGVKFQTIWSIHFWEIAVHGSTDVRTYGWTETKL